MRVVQFNKMDLAGTLAGAGFALFLTYIVSQIEGIEFVGWTRTMTGVVALLMLVAGGIWNIRIQSSAEQPN